jgi:hypothetical protein
MAPAPAAGHPRDMPAARPDGKRKAAGAAGIAY